MLDFLPETLPFEKLDGIAIFHFRVDDHYPGSALDQKLGKPVKQPGSDSFALHFRVDADPLQVPVDPGASFLFDDRPESETDDAIVDLSDEAEVFVGRIELEKLVFVPCPVEVRPFFRSEEFFSNIENLREIVEVHLPDIYPVPLFNAVVMILFCQYSAFRMALFY